MAQYVFHFACRRPHREGEGLSHFAHDGVNPSPGIRHRGLMVTQGNPTSTFSAEGKGRQRILGNSCLFPVKVYGDALFYRGPGRLDPPPSISGQPCAGF